MAYVPRNSGSSTGNMARSSSTSSSAQSAGTGKAVSSALYSTGLFAPDGDRSKAVGTVRVKEEITIPAGSYINLYENERRKGEKDPVFKLQVRAGKTDQPK
jgi:hypothetical protein